MAFTLNNYMEAVSNPNGRFRALEGIYPVTEDHMYNMRVDNHIASFWMGYDGAEHKLLCMMHAPELMKERMKRVSVFTSLIESPHIMPFRYLEKEMLVFDDRGGSDYVDVILHEIPKGVMLEQFFKEASVAGSSYDLRAISSRLNALARWMSDNSFSHGRLTARKMWVAPGGEICLFDYTRSRRETPTEDVRLLGLLCANLYVALTIPAYIKVICRNVEMEETDTIDRLRRSACAMNGLLDESYRSHPYSRLVDMLCLDRPDPGEICDMVDMLAAMPPVPVEMLARVTAPDGIVPAIELPGQLDKAPKYVSVGELSDNRVRALGEKGWCYINKEGVIVIEGPFVEAYDFREGRAVVATETGYGVIARDGHFVIPPFFEDASIDEGNNMIIVTLDGLSGLYTREGEKVTEMEFQQVLPSEEGLFVVRRHDRYGFIRKDGSTAIEVIYEDATGFRNGYGQVSLRGRKYLIDTEGNVIDEVIAKSLRAIKGLPE